MNLLVIFSRDVVTIAPVLTDVGEAAGQRMAVALASDDFQQVRLG